MGRLVIVSNRVGSSLKGNEGGLATAMLAAFDRREVIWLGWSGEVTDEPSGPTRVHREGRLTRMLVDLERGDYEGYYLEFANSVLWPVFHYRVNLAEYGRERWATYGRVNEIFAERLVPALAPDDILWVHDYHMIPLGAARAASTRQAARLRESLSDRRLVIGVDRLDYTKGLVHRFDAVERLLEGNPQYRRAIVVLQIAPPSREDVSEYQRIRAELDARIGRINGRFGDPDHLPLRYVNRSFRQETLFGFYRASRVALVTPLRDGMNLVAKEFVASQDPDDPGVLVLSRFAGAARALDAALIVNPFDVDQIADALDRALAMPVEERRDRYGAMMAQLEEHNVHAWRDAFLDALQHKGSVFGASAPIAAE